MSEDDLRREYGRFVAVVCGWCPCCNRTPVFPDTDEDEIDDADPMQCRLPVDEMARRPVWLIDESDQAICTRYWRPGEPEPREPDVLTADLCCLCVLAFAPGPENGVGRMITVVDLWCLFVGIGLIVTVVRGLMEQER